MNDLGNCGEVPAGDPGATLVAERRLCPHEWPLTFPTQNRIVGPFMKNGADQTEGGTVDPAVSGAAAIGLTKGAGSVAGKQILGFLAKRTQRWRVALAVSRAARADGILIGWYPLGRWLKSADVRIAVESGEPAALAECSHRLAVGIRDSASTLDVAEGRSRVVELVRDESLRRMSEGEGRLVATRRLEHAIGSAGERALLVDRGDKVAFEGALELLHPWRAEDAARLGDRWGPFRGVVIALAAERDRCSLLRQWGAAPPVGLTGAPPECWCWLASVASDYGLVDAALAFVAEGIALGASASYWWARAGVMVGTGSPASVARAQELWARSSPKHPLAAAGEAIVSGEYAAAERILDGWDADNLNDQSLRALLQSAAATGRGEYNRAVAIGVAEAAAHPEGSANALRAAEALVSRGHFGHSEHPLDDFARAFELAIQARDARRTWLGDSVAPILTAVKAAALATDIDRAWRLTQAGPNGDALPHEAKDVRLQQEAAILAAAMGRFESARIISEHVNDPYVPHMVEGWQALTEDRSTDAEKAWLLAWDCAPDDTSRLQVAAALAPLGMRMPDLGSLSSSFSLAIDRIRTVHQVMSASRGEDMSLLRARASDSEQLTVLLADRLMAQDQATDAAAVLEAGGIRWNHPLLMRMAAARYLKTGDYEKAHLVASTALSLGGMVWAGRLETLMIQFESLEAQGQFTRSLAVVREMVTVAPSNLTVRWALIHCLVRAGRISDAWSALTFEGKPVAPRDPGDARIWIGLAAECDNSPEFVQRALATMAAWSHEPDLVAVFLLQIYRGLQLHEREVADSDVRELHRATEAFTEAHPESQVFRKLVIDEGDPLRSLTPWLMEQSSEDPAVTDVRERVERGELPLGLAAELHNRTYAEVCIKTAAGLVYSHQPHRGPEGQAAATEALGSHVVVDATVAATLTLLDRATADMLLGAFLAFETTDSAFRDALGAQQSLNMLSTMNLGWDRKRNVPLISETTPEDAEALARRSDRLVEILARSERRGWPGLKRFPGFDGDGTWLSALDMALSEGRAFWCDDRALRELALSQGSRTFGTVDLLKALETKDSLEHSVASVIRARLVASYHVDVDFDRSVMTLAAEIDGWLPKGAAAALTRTPSWTNANECVRFALDAMARIAPTSPTAITGWTAAVALGLVRITQGDTMGAADNLRILLNRQFAQPWLRADTLPFVMEGIRAALADHPGTADPLRPVLAHTYAQLAMEYGPPQAAEFILFLVKNLADDDRLAAANIILTTDVRPAG